MQFSTKLSVAAAFAAVANAALTVNSPVSNNVLYLPPTPYNIADDVFLSLAPLAGFN
jgi:hypothetical protein